MNVYFMDLEEACDKDNVEMPWYVLRMFDVGVKLFNGIKSTYLVLQLLLE